MHRAWTVAVFSVPSKVTDMIDGQCGELVIMVKSGPDKYKPFNYGIKESSQADTQSMRTFQWNKQVSE